MKRAVLLVVIGVLCLPWHLPGHTDQANSIQQAILGTWKLVSYIREELPSGTKSDVMGTHPSGYINFGREGPVSYGCDRLGRRRVADQRARRRLRNFQSFACRLQSNHCGIPLLLASHLSGGGCLQRGASDATVTIRSPKIREVSFTVKPGQLQRLRTGWRDVSSSVIFELKNGEGLRFDNLAYVQE